MQKTVGIIGLGEIGSSLFSVYKHAGINVYTRDIDGDFTGDVDILNICIPGGLGNFVDIVNGYADQYNAKLVIIHSTVPVGTTRKINKAVHSPIRGVHPNLTEGIKTFVKFIGYNNDTDRDMCIEHYKELGLKYFDTKSSDSTELAKLTSTTYYGLCIAWHGEMKKMCDKYGVDFSTINIWTDTYNKGYVELDMENVVRPNLYPPSKHIGGHCVIPNVELLAKTFKSTALDLILEYAKQDNTKALGPLDYLPPLDYQMGN